MKKILMSALLVMFGMLKKDSAVHQADIARLKLSLAYVKGVETSRLIVIGALGLKLCFWMFIGGLVLVHTTLFLYAPWSNQTKLIFGLVSGGVYLATAATILSKVFAQDAWHKMFHADRVLEDLDREAAQRETNEQSNGDYADTVSARRPWSAA
jgi:hypothetical protein